MKLNNRNNTPLHHVEQLDGVNGYAELMLPGGIPEEARPAYPVGSWTLQGNREKNGSKYIQAVFGKGEDRIAVTLGWITKDQQAQAYEVLRELGGKLVARTEHGDRVHSNEEIKAIAFGMNVKEPAILDAFLKEHEGKRKVEEGDYRSMSLREFVEHVWKNVRQATNAPSTWKREGKLWESRILPALGHLKLKSLDVHKWTMFLAGTSDTWGGAIKRLAQVAYRTCLTYAHEIGAIEEVHAFKAIKNATKRTTEPGEALSIEEVGKLLDAAAHPVHRALFAYVFGAGLRPGEVCRLRWEHVYWKRGEVLVDGTKNQKAEAVVPMTSSVVEELTKWHDLCGNPAIGPVFIWQGKPITDWKRSFELAIVRAGLNVKRDEEGNVIKDADGNPVRRKVICYSARYTYATLGVLAGISEAGMRKGMRHVSTSIILQTTYERLSRDQTRDELRAFPSFTSK